MTSQSNTSGYFRTLRMAAVLVLIMSVTLGVCACRREKLYTEEEFLNRLEEMYDAEFVIVSSEQLDDWKTRYVVALKDDPDQEFDVTNTLRTAGSDIGPVVNSIQSNDLMYYFAGKDAYEGYLLDKSGGITSDYYILPKLSESASYDGKYSVRYHMEDDKLMLDVYSGEEKIFSFPPCAESEWRGVCWDRDYNLWIQIHHKDLVCYRKNGDVWELDDSAVKPDYVVYNIHPGR